MRAHLNNLKLQVARYTKQTAVLAFLLIVWIVLIVRQFTGRTPSLATASVTKGQSETADTMQPDGSVRADEVDEPVILAYWGDVHKELTRDPFDNPFRSTVPAENGLSQRGPADRQPVAGADHPQVDLLNGMRLMGTIESDSDQGQAGAIINDYLYRPNDVIRNSRLQLIRVMDQDSVMLRHLDTGETLILKTTESRF